MPFTFRRSKKVGPVRVNLSKGGVSLSAGSRLGGVNLSKRGVRSHVTLPGTGITYRSGSRKRKKSSYGCLVLLVPLPALGLLLAILRSIT